MVQIRDLDFWSMFAGWSSWKAKGVQLLGAVGFDLLSRPDQSASTVPSRNHTLWKPLASDWWCSSMSAKPWFLLL